jgi:hypothetical protein
MLARGEGRGRTRALTDDAASQAPEVQTMYSLNMPVSAIRTKVRQEFERHRYVSQLKTVDVLLFNSHQEFQVRVVRIWTGEGGKAAQSGDPYIRNWERDGYYLRGWHADMVFSVAGNVEFLEAIDACAQVLPSGGRAYGEITQELHSGLYRGEWIATGGRAVTVADRGTQGRN